MGAPGARDGVDDWLTVNVWTPALGSGSAPVLVWVQGGGYVYGWSGDPTFDGAMLARDGAVVVTFNYRVGAEGFARIAGAPDNRGLLDQVAALRWVQDNIAAFGGDPERVTVFGESAGAGCIAALLSMPSARGLFRRAIAQSVPGLYFTEALAADIASDVAARLGVRATLDDLGPMPPSRLNEAADDAGRTIAEHHEWGHAARLGTLFAPVVDGDVLPAAPWQALTEGASSDVDLVVGHTRDEYRLFLALTGRLGSITSELADDALRALAPDADAYRAAFPDAAAERLYELVHSDRLFRMPSLRLAEAHQGRTFLYELAWESPGMGGGVLGACHGLGLPLTFGTLSVGTGAFLVGDPVPPAAVDLSARVRAAWTSFATTGDPGWPAYDAAQRRTWIIDAEPHVAAYPEETSRRLWSDEVMAPVDLVAAPHDDAHI
jgi:para-nitrobenzyl esterase